MVAAWIRSCCKRLTQHTVIVPSQIIGGCIFNLDIVGRRRGAQQILNTVTHSRLAENSVIRSLELEVDECAFVIVRQNECEHQRRHERDAHPVSQLVPSLLE